MKEQKSSFTCECCRHIKVHSRRGFASKVQDGRWFESIREYAEHRGEPVGQVAHRLKRGTCLKATIYDLRHQSALLRRKADFASDVNLAHRFLTARWPMTMPYRVDNI